MITLFLSHVLLVIVVASFLPPMSAITLAFFMLGIAYVTGKVIGELQ
jgi:hypothetical protein